MRDKKVIHIVPAIKIGGVEKLVISSVVKLNEKVNYRILVVGKADKQLWNELPDTIKSFIDLPSSKNGVTGIIEAVKKLKKEQPDIVISSLWKSAAVVNLMGKRRFLHIGFIHSSKFAHIADRFFLTWQIKNSHLLLADSKSAYSFIHSIKPKAKVEVVPLIFHSGISKGKTLSGSTLKFCFIGRLHPVKGIDQTLEFIKLLHANDINFQFDFYGNDEGELGKIKVFIQDNPSVNLYYKGVAIPWKVQNILSDYHFFVQFSKYEGMAMSVVEAMQNGVVPIVTNVGEIANYAAHLENAIILKNGEKDSLTEAVEDIKTIKANSLYTQLSSNAAKTFAGHESYINKMNRLIESF